MASLYNHGCLQYAPLCHLCSINTIHSAETPDMQMKLLSLLPVQSQFVHSTRTIDLTSAGLFLYMRKSHHLFLDHFVSNIHHDDMRLVRYSLDIDAINHQILGITKRISEEIIYTQCLLFNSNIRNGERKSLPRIERRIN